MSLEKTDVSLAQQGEEIEKHWLGSTQPASRRHLFTTVTEIHNSARLKLHHSNKNSSIIIICIIIIINYYLVVPRNRSSQYFPQYTEKEHEDLVVQSSSTFPLVPTTKERYSNVSIIEESSREKVLAAFYYPSQAKA